MPYATLAQLVLRLPPIADGPPAFRTQQRFVLTALAVNADRDGVAQISVADLASSTALTPAIVRRAVRAIEDNGYLTTTLRSTGSNTYRLNTGRIRDLQPAALLRAQDSIHLLADFGVSDRALRALSSAGIHTLTQLGRHVDDYQSLPENLRSSLHVYLDVRNLGKTGGDALLAGYIQLRELERLRDYYDNNDVSTEMEEGEWVDPRQSG